MTGEVVDAALAERIGLVTEVVAHDRLRDRALGLAAAVAEVPGGPMRALTRIYAESAASQLGPSLEIETAIAREHSSLDGLEERATAVIQRNRRRWPG
ncbi:MAG TPA: hypothetical protein VGD53_20690, partial [Actinoallomurus sp.]